MVKRIVAAANGARATDRRNADRGACSEQDHLASDRGVGNDFFGFTFSQVVGLQVHSKIGKIGLGCRIGFWPVGTLNTSWKLMPQDVARKLPRSARIDLANDIYGQILPI